MLLDLINSNKYLQVNTKFIEIFGLHTAVYLAEMLLHVPGNSDEFFEIDRDTITDKLTIGTEEQILIENNLIETRILTRQEELPSLAQIHLKLDVNGLVNLIASGDEKLLAKVTKLSQINPADINKTGKLSARQKQALGIKYTLKAPNQELLDAYKEWVDGVYANPKGFLSPSAVRAFQRTIDEYAKGDLDLALKIIEIATVHGYRDGIWAINVFKKDYEKDWNKKYIKAAPTTRKAKLEGEVF